MRLLRHGLSSLWPQIHRVLSFRQTGEPLHRNASWLFRDGSAKEGLYRQHEERCGQEAGRRDTCLEQGLRGIPEAGRIQDLALLETT